MTSSDIAAIDLFAGAGGLSYGLQQAGIPVEAGVDIVSDCRYPFETNVDAEFVERDVGAVLEDWPGTDTEPLSIEELESKYPDSDDSVRILVGCAPCQPFSNLNNGQGTADPKKWSLLKAIREVAAELEVDIVAIENVPGIEGSDVYKNGFREWFSQQEYDIWEGVVDCTEYNIPQSRNRYVMLASRLGEIELVDSSRSPGDIVSVRRSFANVELSELDAGEWDPSCHPLHKAADLRGANPKRMRSTKEGEDWHDLPDELKPASEENSRYVAYGRMWWDRPAPTLTTNFYNWGSGRFGHPGYDDDPEESTDRALSIYEAALLQTFPPDFEFIEPDSEPSLGRLGQLIGNAVPPRLGAVIGGSIRRHLVENDVHADFVENVNQSTENKDGTEFSPSCDNVFQNRPMSPADD